ncbi:hypothetical protein [Arthrobacter sp.]|uniref:hypothetical protein n=1 Tax=Arthrobacter sp. TaxID=1667 RepID=UPI002589F2E1|nr:hypothetical protein [Arthrobacter sp.]
MKEPLQLAILLGRGERADMAIDELWRRAQSAVAEYGIPVHCVAGYAQLPQTSETVSHAFVDVVGLVVPPPGRVGNLVTSAATKPGPLGVVGRLAKYNLTSRRVARALKADPQLTDIFFHADVIVSADPEADRAVWMLRRRTSARLMHGPFAMANALSELAKD